LSYFLFFLYCLLFCSLITRLKFFTNSGLSKRILLSLFLIRILVLVIACYINVYVLPVSDSLAFHQMGIEEFHLLFKNPHEYFVNIFQIGYPQGHGRLLDDTHSFWNNLRTNLMAKMLSVFDLFSLKSFLINTLFYNFLIFFGCVALYKVFIKIFPKCFYQLIICIFLLPSALFFSAEIHRDGLILLSISMVIYHLFFILYKHKFSWKRIVIITLFLSLIFLLRNFVFLAFLPALISWILAKKFPKHAFISFLIIYVFTTILFFISPFISPRTNLPQYVSLRQQSFIKIGAAGTSTINIKPLNPTFKSFLLNAPEALNHSLIRPYLWKIKNIEYLPFALEIFLIELLILLLIFYHKKNIHIDPLIYCCIFFSLTMLLITGYTVPIIGAIVRYRSIYFVLLLIPITAYIDWKRMLWHDKKDENENKIAF
jgi:hypothetical protein